METEIITDCNSVEQCEKKVFNEFCYVPKKTLGSGISHGSSDQIRPMGEFGSGAPKNTSIYKPTSIVGRAGRIRPTKPNNKALFPVPKCSNTNSRTRLTEIHWRLSHDFVHSIINRKSGSNQYLKTYGFYIKDIVSLVMGFASNFTRLKGFLMDVYDTLNNIPQCFAFDRNFLSQEFLNIDICTQYLPALLNTQTPKVKRIMLADFTEYFDFVVKKTKNNNFMGSFNSRIQYQNTFFARFNLEKFQDIGKDKLGSIYDFKVFLVLFFVYYADRFNFGKFDMTKYQKEINDFINSITATTLVMKRRVLLKGISFFSLFKALSQISNPNFTVSEDIINKQIQIRSKNIELTIVEESKNVVCFSLMIASHNEIKNAFGTVNMDNILNCLTLDSIFDDAMESIFLDINGNLLVPINEIPSLEAKLALLNDPLVSKSDGLIDYISTISLYENQSKVKNKHRYRDICRKAIPKNPKRQDKAGNKIKRLKNKYSLILKKKKRTNYENMIRKILGV